MASFNPPVVNKTDAATQGLDLSIFQAPKQGSSSIGSGLDFAPDGYGTSKYDSKFWMLPQQYNTQDLNQLRADNQPFIDKLGNGLAKFGGSFTSGLLSVPGTFVGLYGTLANAFDGKWDPSSFWDNGFNKVGNSLVDYVNNNNVNYKGSTEQLAKWYSPDSWATANFWTDTILGNAGYGAAAWVTGAGISQLVGKAAPLFISGKLASILGEGAEGIANTESILNGADAALNSRSFSQAAGAIDSASKNLKYFDRLNKGISLAMAVTSEASTEAYSAYDELKQAKIEQFSKTNGRLPRDQELDAIERDSHSAGNSTYALNLPILAASDILQFGSLLGRKWESELSKLSSNTFALEAGEEFGQYALAKEVKRPLVSALKNVILKENLTEAAQEGLQFIASEGSKNFYMRKYDPKGQDTMQNLIDSFSDASSRLFNTQEGGQNMLAGFFTPLVMPHTYMNIHHELAEKSSNTRQATDILNSYNLKGAIKDIGDNFIRASSVEQDATDAVRRNDRKDYEDLKNDRLKAWILSRIQSGRYDLFEDELDKMSSMRKEEFSNFFGLSQDKFDSVQQELSNLKTKARDLKSSWDKIDGLYSGRFMNLTGTDDEKLEKQRSINLYKTMVWNYYADYKDKDTRVNTLSNEVNNLTNKFFGANDILTNSGDPIVDKWTSQYKASVIGEHLLQEQEDSPETQEIKKTLKRQRLEAESKLQEITQQKAQDKQSRLGGVQQGVNFDKILKDANFSYIEDFTKEINSKLKNLDPEQVHLSLAASGVSTRDFIQRAQDLVKLSSERRLALIAFNNLNKANRLQEFMNYSSKKITDPDTNEQYNIPDYEKMKFFSQEEYERQNSPIDDEKSQQSAQDISNDIKNYTSNSRDENGKNKFTNPDFVNKVNKLVYEGDEDEEAYINKTPEELNKHLDEVNDSLTNILKAYPKIGGNSFSVETQEQLKNLRDNKDAIKDLLAKSEAIRSALNSQAENSEINSSSRSTLKNKQRAAKASQNVTKTDIGEQVTKTSQELQDEQVIKNPTQADTPEPVRIHDEEDFEPDERFSNVGIDNSAYILVAHSDITHDNNKTVYKDGKVIINYDSPLIIKDQNKKDLVIQTGYQRSVFDPSSSSFLKPGDKVKAVYLGDHNNEKVIGLYTTDNKFVGFVPSVNNKRLTNLDSKNQELSNNIRFQVSQIRTKLANINDTIELNTRPEWFAISRGSLFFNENNEFKDINQAFGSDFINLDPKDANTKGGVFLAVSYKGSFSYRDSGNLNLKDFDSILSIDQNNKLRDSKYDGQIVSLIPTNNMKEGKRVYMPILLSTEDQYSSRLNQPFTIRIDAQGNKESLAVGLLNAVLNPGDATHTNELNNILSLVTGKAQPTIADLYNTDDHTLSNLFDKLVYTDTRSVDKKSIKAPFSLQVLKNSDPNDSSRFQISLEINISRAVDKSQKVFKIDIANQGKFLTTSIEDRVAFQQNNNKDKSIEYIGYDELKAHLENKPYKIDSRELLLGKAGNKPYQGFVFKNNELTLSTFPSYKDYIGQLGLLNTNIQSQDYTDPQGRKSKFYFANQQVRFEAPSIGNSNQINQSSEAKKFTNTITLPVITTNTTTVNPDLKPNLKSGLLTKNSITENLKQQALKESKEADIVTDKQKPGSSKPVSNLLSRVLNSDIANQLKQAALKANDKNSFDYFDTTKITSLNQLVYEPLSEHPEVQTEIANYTRKAILNVMYDNYVNNNNQSLSFDKLKSQVKDSIVAVRDELYDMSINSPEDETKALADNMLSYYDHLLLLHNDHDDLFDYRDSNDYKNSIDNNKSYRGFIGFFNLALGDIYSMGIITPSTSYEDIVDYNINEGNYTDRFQENWSLKINPKDTINIRSKIFLAMLPQVERIINSSGESEFQQQTDGLGSTKYYELNNVVDHLLDIASETSPSKFYDELFGKTENIDGQEVETHEYKNDPVIKSLRDRISNRQPDGLTIDNTQIFNQLSTSLLKQRKTMLTVRMTSNLKTNVPSINIIDSSRTRVTNQIIESWVNDFKEQIKDFFVSSSDTTTDEINTTVSKLKPEHKDIFNKAKEFINERLDRELNSQGHYTDDTYKDITRMMQRVGINLSENPEESWIVLKNLNNPLGKNKKQQVTKRLFQKYNPKSKSFKDFFQDTFSRYVLDELTKAANKNKLTLNEPFANSAAALDTWAKISKSNYSRFINATITNVNGDSVYIYTARNYLSNQMLKIKDQEYLGKILEIPFSKYNPIINDLYNDPAFRDNIKLAFSDGLKKDNWQIISTDKAEPGSLELLSFLYFQNNERFEGGRRNMGWYMTTHSDVTSAPLYKMNKYFTELNFTNDNKIELHEDSAMYNNFYGIFKSEVARINQVYKNFLTLKNNLSSLSGQELKDAAHNSGYKEGYDYIIDKDLILPGSGINLYLFGQDNYRNNSHGLYNQDGLINEANNFKPYGGLDPDLLNNGELVDDKLKPVFNKLINPYINNLVDDKIKALKSYESYLYDIETKKETFIDPETSKAIHETSQVFTSRLLDPNYIKGIKKFFEKQNTFQDENNEINNMQNNPNKGELLWKYLVADHALNYSMFLSTWNQLHHDPAFYSKGTTYESFFDNFMKRLKGDISPGDVNYTSEQDKVHYVVFNDIAAKDIKTDLTKEDYLKEPQYVRDFLKSRYNITESSLKESQQVPERFREYAAIYKLNPDDDTISHYENIKIADAQAYITLNEYLYRKWKDGLINNNEVNYLRNKYSNPDLKFTQEELRKDFKLQALKYVYSGSKLDDNSLSYDFNKNSELPLIPVLTKNKVLDNIRASMEAIEQELYKDSQSDINPGVVAVPLSSYKVGADKVINLLDNYGNYNNQITQDKINSVPRENLKKQIQNPIKTELYNTASSQFNKYIHSDIPYTERFALNKFSEKQEVLENNPYKNTLNKGLSNNQMQDTKNNAFLELMKRDLLSLMNDFGMKETGEGVDRDLVLSDINKFVNTLKKEAFTRKGLDLNSIGYLQTIGNKLNIPIDFIPTGSSFESVILSRFNSIINGRQLPGYSFVQSSSMGLHEFDGKNKVIHDSNLKGARLIEDEQGNIIDYTPAEIALTWKFRDKDNNLLKYEDYVNSDGTPKLDKIDPEILHIIGLRIPNTGPNSAGRYKIAKFFPPAYSDTVAVSPELIAQMGSDFDFDKLVSYIYNYDIDGNNKLTKTQSVIHHTQEDAGKQLLSENNKQDFAERYLSDNSQDFQHLLKRERAVGLSIKAKQKELSKDIINITNQIKQAASNNQTLDKDLQRKVAEVLETESLINQYSKYLKNDKSLNNYFKENDIDLNDPNLSEEDKELTKTSEIDNIKEIISNMKDLYSNLNDSINSLNNKKENLDQLRDIREQLKQSKDYDSLTQSALEELKEVTKAKESLIDSTVSSTDFSKLNLKNYSVLYGLQSKEAIENSIIDVYHHMMSSLTLFKKQIQPLTSNWINNKITGKLIENNGVNYSVKDLLNQGKFLSISSESALSNNRLINADADKMIGIAANAQSAITKAQRFNLSLQKSYDRQGELIFGHGLLFKDNNGTIKQESKFEDIPKDDQTYYNTTSPYANPLSEGRYRLDRIYSVTNNNIKLNTSEVVQSILQAALDNQNDPILGYGNLNDTTVNGAMIMTLLGYTDEIVPLINQQVITELTNLKRLVNSPLYNGDFTKREITRDILIKKYASQSGMNDEMVDQMISWAKDNSVSDIDLIDRITPTDIQSEKSLQELLLYSAGITNNLSTQEFAKQQLSALRTFLVADHYGQQLLTYQSATSAESGGLGDSSMIGVKDRFDKYEGLYKVNSKGDVITSVPNLSGIQRMIYGEDEFRSNPFSTAHAMGPKKVMNTFSWSKMQMFYSISPMFNDVVNNVYDELKRKDLGKKKEIAASFKSFILSEPRLYDKLFTGQDEDKFNDFVNNPYDYLLKENYDQNEEGEYNLKINNKESLASAFERISKESNSKKIPYSLMYEVLTSFKTLTQQDNEKFSLVNYVNSNNYKENLDYRLSKSILSMFNSRDKQIKDIGRNLILYGFMTGGVNNANSFVKFIPVEVLNKIDFGSKLRNLLTEYSNSNTNSDTLKDQFLNQFMQHKSHNVAAKVGNFNVVEYIRNSDSSMSLTVNDELFKKDNDGITIFPQVLAYGDGKKRILFYYNHNDDTYNSMPKAGYNTYGISEYRPDQSSISSELSGNYNTKQDFDNFEKTLKDGVNLDSNSSSQEQEEDIEASTQETSNLPGNELDIPESLKDTTVNAALEYVKTSGDTQQSILADFIQQNINTNISVKLDTNLEVPGRYEVSDNPNDPGSITYNPENSSRFNTPKELFNAVLIHETTHAITVKTIRDVLYQDNPNVKTSKVSASQVQGVNNLTTLIELVNSKLPTNKIYNSLDINTQQVILRGIQSNISSPAINPEVKQKAIAEFIANLFAEPKFRDVLNSIKASKDKSFLERVWDNIKQILGIKPGSALAAAFNSINDLIDKDQIQNTVPPPDITPESEKPVSPIKKPLFDKTAQDITRDMMRQQGNPDQYDMREYQDATQVWQLTVGKQNSKDQTHEVGYFSEEQARQNMLQTPQLKSAYLGAKYNNPKYFYVEYTNPDANENIVSLKNLNLLNFKAGPC